MVKMWISYANWINLFWFQLAWFTAVYFQQQAIVPLLLSLGLHFYLSRQRVLDLYRLLWVALIGSCIDSLLSISGVFVFSDYRVLPYWLLLLWAHFALSLNYSMAWLRAKPLWVKCLSGGIFAPLSYFAGVKLSALSLPLGEWPSLLLLAVIWMAFMPVYLLSNQLMGERYEGVSK